MKALFDKGMARQQAATDLVYVLSGEAELSACEPMLQQGESAPEYEQEYQELADLMAGLECMRESDVVVKVIEQTGRYRRRGRYAVAAAVLLCCVSLMWWVVDSPEVVNKMDRHVTRVGEQKQVVLDDGSVIHLNTNSELWVAQESGKRQVVLRRGEAFFDVEKLASNPFSVEAADRVITVLGTSFNVRHEPDSLTVDVATGAVAVHKLNEVVVANQQPSLDGKATFELPGEAQFKLVGGQMATISASGKSTLLASSESSGAWRTGRLVFKQMPLYLVVKELNRYSARKILIEDKSIVELPVSAMVGVDRIPALLAGVGKVWGVQVTSYPDRIVLVAQ